MYTLFSVDDHIIEPPNVWADRVPAKFRESAPHVIEEDGRQYWVYEDRRHTNMGLNAVAGTPKEQWANDPIRFSDMIPGCYDPVARAKDMRSDGIVASVNFPTLPRFGGALFPTFKDKDLADVCVRAWNDFVIDEWCTAVPGMYVPMIICQIWDPKLAADEIRRCAARGARALSFVEDPGLLGMPTYHTDHWDPVWEACQETQTAICLHLSSSGSTFLADEVPPAVEIAAAFTKAASAAVNLMFSPLPRKFPGTQIVWSEGGISWVPAALERADRQYLRHRAWTHLDDGLPSDICKQTMWFCTIEEPRGMTTRHEIGVDRIVWECDYPHSDSTWPESQRIVSEVFADVPRDEIDKITHENAQRLFRWDLPVEAGAAA